MIRRRIRSRSCPSICTRDMKAEKQCTKNKYKDKCRVVKCGKPNANYSKCIANERAAEMCPEKCYTKDEATRVCGLARWIDQCVVTECGQGKFRCGEKPPKIPRLQLCDAPDSTGGGLVYVNGDDAIVRSSGLPLSIEQQATFNSCSKQQFEGDANLQETLAAITDTAVAQGCFISNFVTQNEDGSCTVPSLTNSIATKSDDCFFAAGFAAELGKFVVRDFEYKAADCLDQFK